MEPLASRQLVTTHSPSYSLATGLRPRPGTETVDAASLRQAAIEHFVAHAEANRHRPDRLAGDLDVCLGLLRWAVDQERWASVVRLGRAIDGALALPGDLLGELRAGDAGHALGRRHRPRPHLGRACTNRSAAAGDRSCTVRMDADTTITYRRPAPIG